MKKVLFIVLLCSAISICKAQFVRNIDSLIVALETQELSGKEKLAMYKSIMESTGDSKILVRCINEGLPLAQKEKDKSKESLFYEYTGRRYVGKAMYDSAFFYFNKALKLAIESKDLWQESSVYTSFAVFYGFQGLYRELIENQLKALKIAEKQNDTQSIATSLLNIGSAYTALRGHEQAVEYLEKALSIAETTNSPPQTLTSIHYNLGGLYYNLKDYEKAEKHLLKSLELSQSQHGDMAMESYIQTALGELYCTGIIDLEKAEKYLNRGLEIVLKLFNPANTANAYKCLSILYRMQERYKECDIAATKAWELDSLNMDMTIGITSNITYSNIKLGNNLKAMEFFIKYDSIVHAFNEKSLHDSFNEQQIAYETEKKELKIAALEKEKKLQYLLTGIGAFAFLIVIIAFFLNRKVNRQKIKQLEQEKQIIAAQSVIEGETEERKRLARDLHDGLGGMLSAVKINLDNMDHLQNVRDLLGKSIDELRRLAHNLMPGDLQYGLRVALEEFCNTIPNVRFHFYGEEIQTDDKIKLLFYRCTFELVNNAVKYANAENINVQLVQESKRIALTVADDGCGFDTTKQTKGMGLKNLSDRVAVYNGTIEIVSAPGKGTEVYIVLYKF